VELYLLPLLNLCAMSRVRRRMIGKQESETTVIAPDPGVSVYTLTDSRPGRRTSRTFFPTRTTISGR
jgi:hypothetical protein